ncbi:glucosyltransferase domain-containing protein [Luteimonas sp. SDU101]|uniref:glucosyltransferase domain-containing protein n=1 Tax=Luteimonas sp. SDU101 TaxID=3422593 RepID=UPI003EBF5B82
MKAVGNAEYRILGTEPHPILALLLLLGIFTLFYFSALSGFALSIDDEMGAVRTDPGVWASQGRWLLYLLELWVIPQPTLAFFPMFVFGLCCSIGYLLVARAYGLGLADGRTYLLFLIFCAFPTLYHIINFAGNLVGLGVGILACCAAIHLFARDVSRPIDERHEDHKARLVSFALQSVLVAIAIGAYQSIVLFALAGYLGITLHHMLAHHMPWRDWLARNAWTAAVLAVATALSEAAGLSLRRMLGVPLEYVNGFFRPGLLLEDPANVVLRTLKAIGELYGGDASAYGYVFLAIPALISAGLVGLAVRATSQGPRRLALATFQGAAVLAAPFLLNLATGGYLLPLRSMLGVPVAIWSIVLLGAFSPSKPIRVVTLTLSAVVAVQSLYSFSALQSARQLQFDRDKQLAAEVYFRVVEKIPDFDRSRRYPIAVFGYPPSSTIYPIPRTSTFGASFFQWSHGRTVRFVALLQALGYPGFSAAYEGDNKLVLDMLAMPAWPNPESIRFTRGTVLVKLGDTPNNTYRASMVRAASDVQADPFWRMDQSVADLGVSHAVMTRDATGIALSAGRDVQIVFGTGAGEQLRSCRVLRVSGTVHAEQPDVAQLFYSPLGTDAFSELNSTRAAVGPENATGRVDFLITSTQGFEDRLRFDPVKREQASRVSDLAVSCVVPR